MKVPGSTTSSGCVTTTHSLHCRTELREVDPSIGSIKNWDPNASTNRLSATLLVTDPDDSQYGTVVGQIHQIDEGDTSKPVGELYYSSQGDLHMGVEHTRNGSGGEHFTYVGNAAVGSTFSYEIRYENNILQVALNGGALHKLSTFELDAPLSYFKVGNYNQGDTPSEVHFFDITVSHEDESAVTEQILLVADDVGRLAS